MTASILELHLLLLAVGAVGKKSDAAALFWQQQLTATKTTKLGF